jgi:hypothetical protein
MKPEELASSLARLEVIDEHLGETVRIHMENDDIRMGRIDAHVGNLLDRMTRLETKFTMVGLLIGVLSPILTSIVTALILNWVLTH